MWKPNLECTLTLKRMFKESIERRAFFEEASRKLSDIGVNSEMRQNRMRYYRDSINRHKHRAYAAFVELTLRKIYIKRTVDL